MTSTSASTVPSQQPRAVKRAAVVTHGKPQAIGSALARLANVARESGVELVFAAGESEKHGLGSDGAETSDVDIAVVLGGAAALGAWLIGRRRAVAPAPVASLTAEERRRVHEEAEALDA